MAKVVTSPFYYAMGYNCCKECFNVAPQGIIRGSSMILMLTPYVSFLVFLMVDLTVLLEGTPKDAQRDLKACINCRFKDVFLEDALRISEILEYMNHNSSSWGIWHFLVLSFVPQFSCVSCVPCVPCLNLNQS